MYPVYKILSTSAEHIPLIRELTFRIWPHTYSAIISPQQIDYMLEMMYSESSLQNQMKDGAEFMLVYENDEAVGFASTQEIEPGIFKLHKLYILPTQQGKGTGRFVLDHIIEDIRKKGGTSLQLQVNRNNKAKGFYSKLGFSIIKEADFHIGADYFMNDYVMEKKI